MSDASGLTMTATTTPALFAALAKASAACKAAGLDGMNEHHRYKYASAESIYGEARGPMAANGLSLVPLSETLNGGGEVPYSVDLVYVLGHASGESLTIHRTWPVIPEKFRPIDKALAAALTTCLAYLVRDLLLIPRVDEEVDRRDDTKREEETAPKRPPIEAPKGSGTTVQRPAPKPSLEVEVARAKVHELRAKAPSGWRVKIDADVKAAGNDVGQLMSIADGIGAALADVEPAKKDAKA